jgi:hypothetical protein
MREVITFRNFKERDCATVAERYRVLPPLPFPQGHYVSEVDMDLQRQIGAEYHRE